MERHAYEVSCACGQILAEMTKDTITTALMLLADYDNNYEVTRTCEACGEKAGLDRVMLEKMLYWLVKNEEAQLN